MVKENDLFLESAVVTFAFAIGGAPERIRTSDHWFRRPPLYPLSYRRLAEREGFEPPEGINPQRFSRPPHSTTLPPLQVANYIRFFRLLESAYYQNG